MLISFLYTHVMIPKTIDAANSLIKLRYQKDPRRAWRMFEAGVSDMDRASRIPLNFSAIQKLSCKQLAKKLHREMNILYQSVLEQYKHQPLVVHKLIQYQIAWEQFVLTRLQLQYPSLPYGDVVTANFDYARSYLHHLCQHIDFLISFLENPHLIYPIDHEIEKF